MATTVGIKLDEETRTRLKMLGQAKDRSTHWLMRAAILRYLEVEERYEREKIEDRERWERYADTGVHIPHEEMTVWFDDLVDQASKRADAE